MAKLRGCLSEVTPGAARLLSLRAGISGRPALSAAGTARTLGISIAREGRLERRALRSLRAAHRATGCGASTGATRSTGLVVIPTASALPSGPSAVTPANAGPAPAPASRKGKLRTGVTRGAHGHRWPPPTQSHSAGAGLAPTPGSWSFWTIILILLVAADLITAAVYGRREILVRRRGSGPRLRALAGPSRRRLRQTTRSSESAARAKRRAASTAGDGWLPPGASTKPASGSAPGQSGDWLWPAEHSRKITTSPDADSSRAAEQPPGGPARFEPTAATPRTLSTPSTQGRPSRPRQRWGRHELEVAAVAVTAMAGGLARLFSAVRDRTGHRHRPGHRHR